MVCYEYKEEMEIGNDLLVRLDDLLCKKEDFGLIKREEQDDIIKIEYHLNDFILSDEKMTSFVIAFFIKSKSKIEKTVISSFNDEINEIHLKMYILDLYNKLLLSERSGASNNYVIRIYSRYLNSKQIKGQYLINFGSKVLLKPSNSKFPDKHEPLTEHVIFYDIEINSINIEHARSIAYNKARDINSLLSVLLDVEFDLINSEFRNFIIVKDNNYGLYRYRTGFVDMELGFVVKDNLNGLKSINDKEDLNSMISGPVFIKLINSEFEKDKDVTHHLRATQKPGVEHAFRSLSISKISNNNDDIRYGEIKQHQHIPNEEILIPRCIRKYFSEISKLSRDKKVAFMGAARMYKTALMLSKNEPTAAAAYLVCSIEALAKWQKKSFSELMASVLGKDFDKDISDYFYGKVRSGHFHSGQFVFNENDVNLMTSIDFTLHEKYKIYNAFYNMVRKCIVNWIEKEILALS